MEGPGRLRPSQRVGHDLATKQTNSNGSSSQYVRTKSCKELGVEVETKILLLQYINAYIWNLERW